MKTILITGSTDGIGKLLAAQLAGEGHKLYLHGRNPDKLEDTLATIKANSKNENIKGFVADFSDLGAVQHMIREIKNTSKKLDVLINNAGIFNSKQVKNKEGLDLRYVVNYFAPYLLTKGLLPMLKATTGARIINLSSAAQNEIAYDVLLGKTVASEREAYGQSKLALTMWSFQLAKQLSGIGVIAVNPGSLLNTKMAIDAFGTHWSAADKGSTILHELALSNAFEGLSGVYFDNDQGALGKAHADAYNESKIEKLITVTDKVLKELGVNR